MLEYIIRPNGNTETAISIEPILYMNDHGIVQLKSLCLSEIIDGHLAEKMINRTK